MAPPCFLSLVSSSLSLKRFFRGAGCDCLADPPEIFERPLDAHPRRRRRLHREREKGNPLRIFLTLFSLSPPNNKNRRRRRLETEARAGGRSRQEAGKEDQGGRREQRERLVGPLVTVLALRRRPLRPPEEAAALPLLADVLGMPRVQEAARAAAEHLLLGGGGGEGRRGSRKVCRVFFVLRSSFFFFEAVLG